MAINLSKSSYFRLLRCKQWLKNSFVFVPLLFRGLALDSISFFNASTAFILFCIASSAVYILNDIVDIEQDKKHPTKSKERPLASGEIVRSHAIYLLVSLYGLLLLQIWLFPELFQVIAVYILLNIAYTLYLKHQPIIDIFVISLGFVLRIVAGAVAIAVQTSSWMLITTLCLALYMAAIKRRQEIMVHNIFHKSILSDDTTQNVRAKKSRHVLDNYNRSLLNRFAEISGVSSFVFYSLYVLLKAPNLVLTIPLVIFGMFRYWFVVENQNGGESPTDIVIADKQLMITILLWVSICTYVNILG